MPNHNNFQPISDIYEDGPSNIPDVESRIFHSPSHSRPRSKPLRSPGSISISAAKANLDADAGENSPLLSVPAEREEEDDVTGVARGRSESLKEIQTRPWYRRPHPAWFLPGALLTSISMGIVIGPRLEVFQRLVCAELQESSQALALSNPIELGAHLVGIPGYSFDLDVPIHSLNDTHHSSTWDRIFSTSEVHTDIEVPSNGNQTIELPIGVPPNGQPPPDPSEKCRKDPNVQKAVAQLNILLTLSMGILSSLTTGYWGGFSDRYGRKKIIVLSVLGILVNDVVFWTTVTFRKVLGYKFLVLGPIVEGLLGGHTTMSAGMGAYISDCTSGGSRAHILSVVLGLFFAGIGIGPAIGSFILRHPDATLLSPFYVSMALHFSQLVFILPFLPESLSLSRQLQTRALWKKKIEEKQKRAWKWKRLFGFLQPLKLILPRVVEDDEEEEGGKRIIRTDLLMKRGRKDWNLTVLSVAYGLFLMSMGIYSVKSLYTTYKFNWGGEEIGFMLSFLATCRVISLMVILPLIVKIFRRNPPLPAKPQNSSGFSLQGQSDVTLTNEGRDEESQVGDQTSLDDAAYQLEVQKLKILHDSHFDLFLARLSLLVDFSSYLLITLSHSPLQFLGSAAVQSLAGGGSPALQSLALSLASPHDSGRLLAALGVIQGFSSQVLGPLVYGGMYSLTVGTWPEAVFAIAATVYFLAFLVLGGVRLPKKKTGNGVKKGKGKIRERGRSRTRRETALTSSSF